MSSRPSTRAPDRSSSSARSCRSPAPSPSLCAACSEAALICQFATHALHLLPRVDRSVFLGEVGRITEVGPHATLLEAQSSYASLIRNYSAAGEATVDTTESLGKTAVDGPNAATIMQADSLSNKGADLKSA